MSRAAVLEAAGTVLTNKYAEVTRASATTRASRSSTRSRSWRPSAPGAVRRGPRQRPAVLRLARQPRRLPGVPVAGRHGDGHGAADGRPPDPRLAVSVTGKWFRSVQYGVRPRHRPGRLRRGTRPGPQGTAEGHLLRRHGDTRASSTSRRSPRSRSEVGALLVADIAHIAGLIAGGAHPSPVGHAPRDHHHHAQDPARPARRA